MKTRFGLFNDNFLKYPVEFRFLVMIPWFASLLTATSVITGLLLRDNLFTITCSVSTIIFVFTYLLIRNGKSLRLAAWIMAMNTLALTNFVWFSFEGSRGTSPVLILMLLVCISLFFKGFEKLTAILIVIINVSVLLYFEYVYPNLIKGYSGVFMRLFDMVSTFTVCGIFIVFVIHGTLKSYFNEKYKAGEVERLKSAFLLNISHEIRTPLNAILGFSNLISQPVTTKKERQLYSKFVSDACANMVNLVEEIIDIAKIESKQVNVHKVRLNVTELLWEIFNNFRQSSAIRLEKNINFKINDQAVSNNVFIDSDPAMVKRILLNLVDNSIKFTQSGFIEVGYNVRPSDILFYVKDSGIGIPEEKQKMVFDSFQKVASCNDKLYNGIGLGLTLCKRLLELLNGKIWVNSEVNKGSTFFFTVPFDKIEVCAI